MGELNRQITYIHVNTWGDLKSTILPAVSTFCIGLLLLLFKFHFLGTMLLLTGPCLILGTCLNILKDIKKDKKRGCTCPECNSLLRYREISGIDDGTFWDGCDYYCFKCRTARPIEEP